MLFWTYLTDVTDVFLNLARLLRSIYMLQTMMAKQILKISEIIWNIYIQEIWLQNKYFVFFNFFGIKTTRSGLLIWLNLLSKKYKNQKQKNRWTYIMSQSSLKKNQRQRTYIFVIANWQTWGNVCRRNGSSQALSKRRSYIVWCDRGRLLRRRTGTNMGRETRDLAWLGWIFRNFDGAWAIWKYLK